MKMYFIIFITVLSVCSHGSVLTGGLSSDFQQWLNLNGYAGYLDSFMRSDLNGRGSFGGRTTSGQTIDNQPLVIVHGNSDQALSGGQLSGSGWDATFEYFMEKGFTEAELYATTWGPADPNDSLDQVHSCKYLQILRMFVEAVLEYTGADKIDLVSHSMGVTLARKIVKGGVLEDQDGMICDLGDPISDQVDTFLGICGGNRGLSACYYPLQPLYPACNKINGFFPGTCWTVLCPSPPSDMSKFLYELNDNSSKEGSNIYTFWSKGDEMLGGMDLVWGYPTSRIVGQNGERVSLIKSHMDMKLKTAEWQYNAVVAHKLE